MPTQIGDPKAELQSCCLDTVTLSVLPGSFAYSDSIGIRPGGPLSVESQREVVGVGGLDGGYVDDSNSRSCSI